MDKETEDRELKEAELFPGSRKTVCGKEDQREKAPARPQFKESPEPPSMSMDQIRSVAKSVEMLLTEAEQIRNRCKQQNADARILMEELRQENCELVQRYQQAEHEMEEVKKALEELMETKAAFDARERQLREAV